MSLRIAVASSDHTLDQYIFIPVVQLLMKSIGKPRARVFPIRNPRMQGDAEYFAQVCELLDKYGPVADVIVYVIDVDGRPDRVPAMNKRLDACKHKYRSKAVVVGAVNEAEVWAMWGSRSILPNWDQVRGEPHPKETYFKKLLTEDDEIRVDKGRTRLVSASIGEGWTSLKRGCPELATLEAEIKAILA